MCCHVLPDTISGAAMTARYMLSLAALVPHALRQAWHGRASLEGPALQCPCMHAWAAWRLSCLLCSLWGWLCLQHYSTVLYISLGEAQAPTEGELAGLCSCVAAAGLVRSMRSRRSMQHAGHSVHMRKLRAAARCSQPLVCAQPQPQVQKSPKPTGAHIAFV